MVENCPETQISLWHSTLSTASTVDPTGKLEAPFQANNTLSCASSLQEELPGVQEWFSTVNSSVHAVADKCDEMDVKVKEVP